MVIIMLAIITILTGATFFIVMDVARDVNNANAERIPFEPYNTTVDATIKDMKYVPGRVSALRNDIKHMQKRLSSLEDKFAYHIQSTDELKSKA